MKMYSLAVIFLFLSAFVHGSGLPAKHEVERLLLAVQQSIDSTDWQKAEHQLSLMRDLDVTQPPASYYFEGLTYARLGHYSKAQKVLEAYVVSSGQEGKYYKQALLLITEAEEKLASLPVNTELASGASVLETVERDGYVKSLQALYLTDSPVEALTMQINSLLSAHPFTGSRIKKNGVKEGLIYQLSVAGSAMTLQEKSYRNGAPTLSASTMNVLGLDPFISAECSHREYACWLLHPTDKHQRWIKIDYDELALSELRDAMVKLLQSLQKDR